jgi:chemotaxis signal transduction protein
MANTISQYLTFSLYKGKYAVSVMMSGSPGSCTDYKSSGNARIYERGFKSQGSVVPVIDLRRKFSLPEAEQTIDTVLSYWK